MLSASKNFNGTRSYIIVAKSTNDNVTTLGATPEQITGTFTKLYGSSDWTLTAAGGRLTYTGATTKNFIFQMRTSQTLNAVQTVTWKISKDGGSTFIDYATNLVNCFVSGHYQGPNERGLLISMATNEYIEVWVNVDSGSNTLGTQFSFKMSMMELIT